MRDELFPALTFPQFGISLLLTLQNESSAAAAPSAKSSSSRQSTLERERGLHPHPFVSAVFHFRGTGDLEKKTIFAAAAISASRRPIIKPSGPPLC